MSLIIQDLPYHRHSTTARVVGHEVRIKPFQIIVWVGLSPFPNADPSTLRRFPAVLDTGHSHNFSIRDDHLSAWAGIDARSLPTLRAKPIRSSAGRQQIPLKNCFLWIYSNRPGERDTFSDVAPSHLETDEGIAVHPSRHGFPRLPVLGLRTLTLSKMTVSIDGHRLRVNLNSHR